MGNEEIRQILVIPQLIEKLQDLCLYGNIQRRYRFIQDNEGRIQGNCPCNAGSLLHAAGKAVWICIVMFRLKVHFIEQFQGTLLA